MSEEEMSKSKKKREERKKIAKEEKKKNKWGKVIETVAVILIAAAFITAVILGIRQSASEITPAANYSEGLTEAGFIEGEKLSSVKDLNLENLVIPKSEVEYTEEEIDTDINNFLETTKYYDHDSALTVKDQDTVNIDYVGYVDGVAFDGGNTNGAGAELVIGSGLYIDDFEQQLIGSHPGDAVEVNVTFPDPYENNPDLAGKEAKFDVTVNGIQVAPELTDELVLTYYEGYASTVDELRTYFKENGEKTKLDDYIADYINENASASKLPKKYVKSVASLLYYTDQKNMEYYNSYYQYYLGYNMYNTLEDYTGLSASEYQKDLMTRAEKEVMVSMTFDKIFLDAGLTPSDETIETVYSTYGDEATYGKPFLTSVANKLEAMKYICEKVTIQ